MNGDVDDDSNYPCQVKLRALDDEGRPIESDSNLHTVRCKYVIGCDGGKSMVRKTMSLDFKELTQSHQFCVADLRVSWGVSFDHSLIHVIQAEPGVMICLPMSGDRWRILVSRASPPLPSSVEPHCRLTPIPTADELQGIIEPIVPGSKLLGRPSWCFAYAINCRLAESFKRGRAVIVGDAAHSHPPVFGEGLNAAIADAYNLGWKLAAVLHGASPFLLDTYNTERRHAASEVIKMTSSAFDQFLRGGRAVRAAVCIAAPLASHLEFMRKGMSRNVSQLEINYQKSTVVGPRTMGLQSLAPGHRVPDCLVLGTPIPGSDPIITTDTERKLYDYTSGTHHTVLLFIRVLPKGSKAKTLFGCELKKKEAVRFNTHQVSKLARLGRLLVEGFGGREREAPWGGARLCWVLTGLGDVKTKKGEVLSLTALSESIPSRLRHFFSSGTKIRGPHNIIIDHLNQVTHKMGLKFTDPEPPTGTEAVDQLMGSGGFAVIRPDGVLGYHGYANSAAAWTGAADYALNWFGK
eukprot:GHVN01030280.1.p1 GENE.GHVN01030280.1~~GHVN01030280.1.p1  ORF type:complete len:550 (-),score=103.92 GHVN01030280.1:101-1663(-)